MKPKEILVFGATGFIGSHLIRRLTKNNYKVKAFIRNRHSQRGINLRTQGNFGYLEIIETNIFDIDKISEHFKTADICINLIGILNEKKNNTFKNIHESFPEVLSKICKMNNLKHLIHLSALKVDESQKESAYARSKFNGEELIKNNFNNYTIIRPSVVYGSEDKFTNSFMKILSFLPLFPLYYNGKTKFSPIFINDLADFILYVVENKIYPNVLEAVGNEIIEFKKLIQIINKSLEIKRLLIPMPLFIAKLSTSLIEKVMPTPLITLDQLKLLKYDSIKSNDYKSNLDFNIGNNTKFETEIEQWSYLYKQGGEYNKKK